MVIPDVAPSSTTGFWRTTGFVTGAARDAAGGGTAAGLRATGDALRLTREGALVEVEEVFLGRRVEPGLAFLDFGDF
jgi:hypothetical protein